MTKQLMPKKLLLLEDVEGLGRSGDIVSARPGYVRNFLLPRKLAVIAHPHALKMQAKLQQARLQKAVEDKQESEAVVEKLQEVTLTTIVKVDQEGHMYGSVSALDVVHLMQEQAAVAIEKRFVQLAHPIKEVGVHVVKLKLKEGITTSVTLKVVPETEAS